MSVWLFAFWFFLPAGLANMSPVLANKIPLINQWHTPLDFGQKFRGKRIFGTNKSWRGVVFGTVVGAVTAQLQAILWPDFIDSLIVLGYPADVPIFALGGCLGFGALAADAMESFLKRQIGVAPGESWFPLDQIDYIIGGLLAASLLVRIPPLQSAAILCLYFGLHLVTAYIGFLLKLKDKPI